MSRMFLSKEFCPDGIGLRVEAWITFFNKQHLVHKAFKRFSSLFYTFGYSQKIILKQLFALGLVNIGEYLLHIRLGEYLVNKPLQAPGILEDSPRLKDFPKNEQLAEKRSFEGNCETLRTIF